MTTQTPCVLQLGLLLDECAELLCQHDVAGHLQLPLDEGLLRVQLAGRLQETCTNQNLCLMYNCKSVTHFLLLNWVTLQADVHLVLWCNV